MFIRLAVLYTFALTSTVLAATPDRIPTRCSEREVVLDGRYSVAVLEECGGEQAADDLLWHLDRIDQIDSDLDGSFQRGSGGAGSVVYIMDTGVRADHQEFERDGASRVIAGIDVTGSLIIGDSACVSNNKALAPCFETFEELLSSSHGTAVASIIGGNRIGVAPAASLVSVRIMNERGLTTTAKYMQALDAIIGHAWSSDTPQFRTAVVNISGWVLERLGAGGADLPMVRFAAVERKIREMIGGVDAAGRPHRDGKRFLFVVAANNLDGGCGPSGVIDRFPAILGAHIDGVVTVGGMTPGNSWWSGGCRGGVEVLAPAQAIFSATITARDHYRGRRPNHRSGTSFATPIVAGIAARLLSDRPDLTPQQLEAWIRSTPSRITNPHQSYADGRVAYAPAPAPTAVAASSTGSGADHLSR